MDLAIYRLKSHHIICNLLPRKGNFTIIPYSPLFKYDPDSTGELFYFILKGRILLSLASGCLHTWPSYLFDIRGNTRPALSRNNRIARVQKEIEV